MARLRSPDQLRPGRSRKLRHVQPDLVNARDEHTQVVCDHFAQHFVELADLGLAAERVSELGLDYGERGPECRPLPGRGRTEAKRVRTCLFISRVGHGRASQQWFGRRLR